LHVQRLKRYGRRSLERNLGLTRANRTAILALTALLAAVCIFAWLWSGRERPLPAREEAGIRVDINSAGWEQLTLLPGIGEKTARLIVADRQANGRYTSIEDLERVKGIGPALVRRIGPYADCR
jgi:competence ComEA-like helix-hairpin-helix protein